MNRGLLTQRRFAPLFWVQALGACNDNLLRNTLLLMLTFVAVPRHGWDLGLAINLAAGLFILPFLLLSAWGGELADRLDKRRLVRLLKLAECILMALAAVAIWYQSLAALFVLLVLAGTQSALFGAVKFAILPHHLPSYELGRGNAWIHVGTFAAILAGALLAGVLAALPAPWSRPSLMAALVGIALLGAGASLALPPTSRTPAAADPAGEGGRPRFRPLTSLIEVLRGARREPVLWPAIQAISVFWFLGACFLTQLPAWAHQVAGGEAAMLSLLLAAFAGGVGAGALACAKLSAGRLEFGLVPLGALIIGAASLLLAGMDSATAGGQPLARLLEAPAAWRMLAGFALVGVGGGIYIVPLYTLLQLGSHEARRGQIIASNNIVNALLMVVAAGYGWLMLSGLGLDLQSFVASLGGIALAAGVAMIVRHPRPVLRLLVFALVALIYRLRLRGRHHVPARGPALVVCNHVSFMDALVIGGACPRPLRFLMDRPIYESPWLNWLFRLVGAIPVDSERSDPGGLRRTLDQVSQALRHGEVVMLFPEGRLTRDGEVQAFRRGLDLILARNPVPVVPAGLAGLWGSWTSNHNGPALSRLPRRFQARVALVFGEPVPAAEASRDSLADRVTALKAEADAWITPGTQAASRGAAE
ncbi:MFS transporter [Halomonas sp. YLGW01]|uniref:MFS transporter n=1 Tax=Halomonas sp. YLGW01 TaxID=2773308 RepID=UPI001F5B927E|nr:MFS transporter [Halomonas sp. YLGW01]